ncbi:ABC transporter substrate-binding protein [Cohnella phaseoli]|uniref:ABC-type glycerol-3-phosphate transport system substrate-binding protein n=1 Tax=Cohnella phaseoli TaxID=456490 RepID=A0A3D9JS70_9BACL|nr:extracellular solute-binding protein [Cohnella phaseoli]RED76407.1 ABC-type glycerol-3-phosphate transport system substrate-binding protein [Cohnella phaseoli]
MKASSKTIVTLLVLLSLFATLLAGCGGSGDSGSKESSSPAAANGGGDAPISFKIASWAGPGKKAGLDLAIAEYKKIKPNVTISFEEVAQNNADFDVWMAAQLAGNQEPEVIMDFSYDLPYTKYNDKGYNVLEMDPYLEKTSPYTNQKWGDSFREVDLNLMRSTRNGKLNNIATSMVTLKIAYNKDIYDQLGLKAPKTFPEMIANFEAIRQANIGTEPFSGFLKVTSAWDWFARFTAQQTQEQYVSQIDSLYKNNKYEQNEYVKAVDEGIIDVNKPEVRGLYELFKQFTNYWAPGAMAMTMAEARDMWLQGKAAHTFTINIDAKPFASDMKPSFNWDTFEFPVITKEIAPTSNEDPAEFGDLADAFVVMPSAIKKNIQDEVMDFIMFYTSPAIATQLADMNWITPTASGIEPNVNLERYLPKYRPQNQVDLNSQAILGTNARQFVLQQIQRYVLNDITTDQLVELIDKNMKEEAEKIKQEKGWSKDNNYGNK